MSYLIQARNEAVLCYPNINKDSISYFNHLLFTIGNGIVWSNGNPDVIVEFNRPIPYTDYYKFVVNFDEMRCRYIETHEDIQVATNTNQAIGIHEMLQDDVLGSTVQKEELNKYRAQYSALSEITVNQMVSTQFWQDQLINSEYYPIIRLSQYSAINYVNTATEQLLVQTTCHIINAYIWFYQSMQNNMAGISAFKNPYLGNASTNLMGLTTDALNDLLTIQKRLKKL